MSHSQLYRVLWEDRSIVSAAVLGTEPHAAACEVGRALAIISNWQWDARNARGGIVLVPKWHSPDGSV